MYSYIFYFVIYVFLSVYIALSHFYFSLNLYYIELLNKSKVYSIKN